MLASGLVLPFIGCDSGSSSQQGAVIDTTASTASAARAGAAIDTFGIQLWSVKQEMLQDPRGTLTKLASYGYKQIEGFEGEKGLFWGMTNKEFKALMDELNMSFIASHAAVEKDLDQKAQQASEIGMNYLIDPHEGGKATLDDYKRMAERFNKNGEICKKHGIKFAYHNHDYTFKEIDGVLPQNLLIEQTDKDLVDFELDLYWVVAAGNDPAQQLNQHKGRYKLVHVKDKLKNVATAEEEGSTILGQGSIDYPSILKTAKDNGVEYFIVEQEHFKNTTPMQSSEQNSAYMKNIRI